jgi:hypothetical protein
MALPLGDDAELSQDTSGRKDNSCTTRGITHICGISSVREKEGKTDGHDTRLKTQ